MFPQQSSSVLKQSRESSFLPDIFSFGGKFTQEIPGAFAFPKYLQDEIKLPFGKL